MIFAKQSKVVGIIQASTLVTRSDPTTDTKKLRIGSSVPHSRKGSQRGGRTWWCSSPAKGPKKTLVAPGVGQRRLVGRPVAAEIEGERERECARWAGGGRRRGRQAAGSVLDGGCRDLSDIITASCRIYIYNIIKDKFI